MPFGLKVDWRARKVVKMIRSRKDVYIHTYIFKGLCTEISLKNSKICLCSTRPGTVLPYPFSTVCLWMCATMLPHDWLPLPWWTTTPRIKQMAKISYTLPYYLRTIQSITVTLTTVLLLICTVSNNNNNRNRFDIGAEDNACGPDGRPLLMRAWWWNMNWDRTHSKNSKKNFFFGNLSIFKCLLYFL